jgi:fucose 4-O-acetylase-like acetyltransferase
MEGPGISINVKPTTRDHRLDVARGAAIIAIVLVHVTRGLHSAGQLDLSVQDLITRGVGLWCLTVFAFVGGTFVPRAVEKIGLGVYLRDRSARFVAVYLIWMAVQGALKWLAGGEVNHPTSLGQLLQIWRPDGQLWYLPFLILVTAIFVPMRPWLTSRAPVVLGIATAISVVFWGYDGGCIGLQGLGLVVFFVAGMALGTARVQAVLDRFSVTQAAVISVLTLAATAVLCIRTDAVVANEFWREHTPARTAIGFVLTVVGSAAILLFGQAARSSSLLALCGRRSLDIYLAHIIMISGTRIVLLKLGVHQIWLMVALSLLIGVGGSLALATLCRRVGLGWVFDGPSWITRLR